MADGAAALMEFPVETDVKHSVPDGSHNWDGKGDEGRTSRCVNSEPVEAFGNGITNTNTRMILLTPESYSTI